MVIKKILISSLVLSSLFVLGACSHLENNNLNDKPNIEETTENETFIVNGPMSLTFKLGEITKEKILSNYFVTDKYNNEIVIINSEVLGIDNIDENLVGTHTITLKLYVRGNKVLSYNVNINIVKNEIPLDCLEINFSKTIVDKNTGTKRKENSKELYKKADSLYDVCNSLYLEAEKNNVISEFMVVLKSGLKIPFFSIFEEDFNKSLTMESVENIDITTTIPYKDNESNINIKEVFRDYSTKNIINEKESTYKKNEQLLYTFINTSVSYVPNNIIYATIYLNDGTSIKLENNSLENSFGILMGDIKTIYYYIMPSVNNGQVTSPGTPVTSVNIF